MLYNMCKHVSMLRTARAACRCGCCLPGVPALFEIGTSVLIPILAALAQAAPLRIAVLEGEGAVNVIQQKTAVRPLVEIRDANNLPVPGATVTFTIGSGQPAAFAGGTQSLTVTTSATGQAAASGLTATGPGAIRIQVQAASQGRFAATAITQTNFATAAAAAAAGAGAAAGTGGASGAAAGAGAAGGGGGVSATTIGIAGAAIGGGAVAATQLAGQQDSDDVIDTFNGTVNGQIAVHSSSGTPERPINCTHSRAISGSLQINLRPDGTGDAGMQLTITPLSVAGGCIPETMSRPLGTADP